MTDHVTAPPRSRVILEHIDGGTKTPGIADENGVVRDINGRAFDADTWTHSDGYERVVRTEGNDPVLLLGDGTEITLKLSGPNGDAEFVGFPARGVLGFEDDDGEHYSLMLVGDEDASFDHADPAVLKQYAATPDEN